MPKSTMHLWVAKKIADRLKFEASASFLLGNIAPDAVSVRQDRSKKDKQIAHLRQPDFADGYKNSVKILKDFKDNGFLKGCALHIMLDDMWVRGPYYTTLKTLEKKLGKKQARLAYLRDMEYVECWLFRQNTSRALWNAVMNAPLERFFDILTPGEIYDFRKLRYTKLNEKKVSTPSKHITLDIVYAFIDEAVIALSRELSK
jgi:hypothetical protein